ncbi:hypothetical protein [Pseudomonas phage D6]|nr:hypothetical protein [Pseudomonas phage D6]
MFEQLLSSGKPLAFDGVPVFWLDPSDLAVGSTALVDRSGMNVTISNPSSLAVADVGPKAGMKSVYFPGNAVRWLRMPYTQLPNFLTGDFTIEFWYKPESRKAGGANIIGQWRQAAGQGGFLAMLYDNAGLSYNLGSYSENSGLLAGFGPSTLQWDHWAVTRNGNLHRVWVNGKIAAETSNSTTRAQLAVDWCIGAYYGTGANPPQLSAVILNGWLTDVRMYQACKYKFPFTP